MSRSEDSRNQEQRKPTLHIAPWRHRPAFPPIVEKHKSENALCDRHVGAERSLLLFAVISRDLPRFIRFPG